jgi:hypothetical protein
VSENDLLFNENNIKRFAQRLSIETNKRTRRTLCQLLLEEEERFGLQSWHLKGSRCPYIRHNKSHR